MNEPAAIHCLAVKYGFDDLLTWEYDEGHLVASVEVHGLEGPHSTILCIPTVERCELLEDCLAECEGHGLLWREDACLLYAARRLGVRPQPWAYSESDEINRLFDAIGNE